MYNTKVNRNATLSPILAHATHVGLGASKIPQICVGISLQANPIPLGYIKADIKF